MPPDQGHGSPFGSGPVLTRYHTPRQGAESLAGRPAEHRAGFSPRGRLAGALRMQLRPRATARAQARQSGDFGGWVGELRGPRMGCSIGTESHYAAFPLVTSAEDAGFEPARV
jgi:hypothetical protein